jgi:hypothetical protein
MNLTPMYFFQNLRCTDRTYRLIIVYLFIARCALSYGAMLIFRVVALRISAKLRLEYLKVCFSAYPYFLIASSG